MAKSCARGERESALLLQFARLILLGVSGENGASSGSSVAKSFNLAL